MIKLIIMPIVIIVWIWRFTPILLLVNLIRIPRLPVICPEYCCYAVFMCRPVSVNEPAKRKDMKQSES